MSFLVNLIKSKKSPEQMVKLAVASLHELPPGLDENYYLEEKSFHRGDSGGDTCATEVHDTVPSQLGGPLPMGTSFSTPAPEVKPGLKANDRNHSFTSLLHAVHILPGDRRRAESELSDGSSMHDDNHHPQHRKSSISRGMSKLNRSTSMSSLFFSDPGKNKEKNGSISNASPPNAGLQTMTSFGAGSNDGHNPTAMERLAKRLLQMKMLLYGDGEKEVDKDKCLELAEAVVHENLFPLLMERFNILPFESRKDTAQIFNNLCRHNLAGFADPYIAQDHFGLVLQLVDGYSHQDIALNCGSMLRECIRHEEIARKILFGDAIWVFFDDYVHLPNFDVASDSFATLRDLMTRHKALAAEFLDKKYEEVFERYKSLLRSENYVTRRQSLKMLGELLLDRSNFSIMIKYINSKENLKTVMNLLRDKSGNIQFEAFHVFKVFVANPKKPPEIIKIFCTNREKLVAYLGNFHNDRDDEQFREEKSLLISTLMKLEYKEPPKEGATANSTTTPTATAAATSQAR